MALHENPAGGCGTGTRVATSARVLTVIPKAAAVAAEPAKPFAPVCASFRRYLKAKGLKFTPERAAVLDATLTEDGLFSAEQVVESLKTHGHRGSRATVYRTLTHLHDAGILKQVFFDTSQTYYEVIAGRETSDYLVCVDDGRVVEFSSERVQQLCNAICRELGFEPVSHQLHIYGIRAAGDEPTKITGAEE